MYKDVHLIFTDKKAGKLKGMFVFCCVVSNSLYCRVCLFILWRDVESLEQATDNLSNSQETFVEGWQVCF